MPIKRNRVIFSSPPKGSPQARRTGAKVRRCPPPPAVPSDVRPEKVAKAKELIAREAYPNTKVVQSLAEQIARFF